MKVGDLVELSASGRKLKNWNSLHDKKGIVLEQCYGGFFYRIHWFYSNRGWKAHMRRTDIKHVKAKKKLTTA